VSGVVSTAGGPGHRRPSGFATLPTAPVHATISLRLRWYRLGFRQSLGAGTSPQGAW
jgi:hypothetical protein